MAGLVSFLVFSGACAAAIWAMFATIAPRWQAVLSALAGEQQLGHAPLANLVRAERRIAVRRWAAPSPVQTYWREAA